MVGFSPLGDPRLFCNRCPKLTNKYLQFLPCSKFTQPNFKQSVNFPQKLTYEIQESKLD